ncbi:hypothetical protein [Streptomyces sp. NPDC048111]|uniref:hypothetical protein n=1 Tax=Streptomyces sp. NPDC048111 TaxID=3365500 RepID=UPI0037107957
MTTTNISRAAAPAPVSAPAPAPDKPVLFSDEASASAVTKPVPGRGPGLPNPLDTLTWQQPPARQDEDESW